MTETQQDEPRERVLGTGASGDVPPDDVAPLPDAQEVPQPPALDEQPATTNVGGEPTDQGTQPERTDDR